MLTQRERDYIGRAWFQDGLAEHASVASFARFALFALKLGAPPALLSEIARAMGDEIRHAKLCFSVAERFLPRKLGPGPFDIGTIGVADQAAAAILAGTVMEGCVGETIAAAAVRRACDEAADEAIVRVLREIAGDEARHADLAWDFVAWMLARDHALVPIARAAFEEALSALGPDDPEIPPPAAERYGILAPAKKRAVRAEVIESRILPRAAALLGAPAPAAAPNALA